MDRQEFQCDTPDCRHWEEDACTLKASIMIQEHCCVEFEKRPDDRIVIEVRSGLVMSVYTTLEKDVDVKILDFDNNVATDEERTDMYNALESVKTTQQRIY